MIKKDHTFKIEPLGDRGLVFYFDQEISARVHEEVMGWTRTLESNPLPFQKALIPAYASLTLLFSKALTAKEMKFLQVSIGKFKEKNVSLGAIKKTQIVEVPVIYGGEEGPDLEEVARIHQLTVEEVIRLHSEPLYEVYQIGFTPGFPYLGGLPPQLRTPRLSNPRLKVLAGSVGIGDAQTGVYTVDGPGGWRIIGRTLLPLFDHDRNPPALLKAGMKVKFVVQNTVGKK